MKLLFKEKDIHLISGLGKTHIALLELMLSRANGGYCINSKQDTKEMLEVLGVKQAAFFEALRKLRSSGLVIQRTPGVYEFNKDIIKI